METHAPSIVVIGASAGGIQALLELVAELPASFDAPVLVVVHIGSGRSMLPTILARRGALPASHGDHGAPLLPGHIYVAPPDYHMLVRHGRIELSHGPRENHSRPAIDPLFRSAATAFGAGVTGIILSGALSDGSAGLLMIKARGGTVMVQDPAEAVVGGMPESALSMVAVDHVLTASGIGRLLAENGGRQPSSQERAMADPVEQGTSIIRQDFKEQEQDRRTGELTMYTCPDCGGSLWQTDGGPALRFECHVGHAWGVDALFSQKSIGLEEALWTCVRMLEERATLSRQVATRIRRESPAGASRSNRVDEQATLDEQRADTIRAVLEANTAVAVLGAAGVPNEG